MQLLPFMKKSIENLRKTMHIGQFTERIITCMNATPVYENTKFKKIKDFLNLKDKI